MFSITKIYTNFDKLFGGGRKPASLAKPDFVIKKRPVYHLLEDKTFPIRNITFPIYIKNASSIKTMLIDLNIISSNRYIKAYLFEYDHLIKDRLNSNLQPIVPTFPLTQEGKQLIRDKIIEEINLLLKEQKIKGKIEQVLFKSIISG